MAFHSIRYLLGCCMCNASKTEVLWCAHLRRLHQLPTSHFALAATCATSTTSMKPRHLRRRRTHHSCPWLEDRYMLLFGRYAAFNGLSAGRCYYLSSRHSCFRAWIMEVGLLQAFPRTYWTVCSQSSMQQHVSFTEPQVRPCVSIASGTALAFCC